MEEKKIEQFVVIKYVGQDRKGLTVDKLYAVETDEDYIDSEVFDNFGAYTVFDDNGELREVENDEYQVVQGVSERDWFNARSKKRLLEQY